jgi:hypothetical protein
MASPVWMPQEHGLSHQPLCPCFYASGLAHDFLEWFAREQLEECSSADTLLKMIRRAGESGLMMVENAVAAGRALGFGAPNQEP